jgi:hypothetical protein
VSLCNGNSCCYIRPSTQFDSRLSKPPPPPLLLLLLPPPLPSSSASATSCSTAGQHTCTRHTCKQLRPFETSTSAPLDTATPIVHSRLNPCLPATTADCPVGSCWAASLCAFSNAGAAVAVVCCPAAAPVCQKPSVPPPLPRQVGPAHAGRGRRQAAAHLELTARPLTARRTSATEN